MARGVRASDLGAPVLAQLCERHHQGGEGVRPDGIAEVESSAAWPPRSWGRRRCSDGGRCARGTSAQARPRPACRPSGAVTAGSAGRGPRAWVGDSRRRPVGAAASARRGARRGPRPPREAAAAVRRRATAPRPGSARLGPPRPRASRGRHPGSARERRLATARARMSTPSVIARSSSPPYPKMRPGSPTYVPRNGPMP